jgi:hypothetical protein
MPTNDAIGEFRKLYLRAIDGEAARLELGRKLLAIRPRWPTVGRSAGGWAAFLNAAGIPKRSAQRYMAMARNATGNRDSVSQKRKPTPYQQAYKAFAKLSQADRVRLAREFGVAVDYDTVADEDNDTDAPSWAQELGVMATCSVDELRSAYRKRARETHPDVGGTADAFLRVRIAYEQGRRAVGVVS